MADITVSAMSRGLAKGLWGAIVTLRGLGAAAPSIHGGSHPEVWKSAMVGISAPKVLEIGRLMTTMGLTTLRNCSTLRPTFSKAVADVNRPRYREFPCIAALLRSAVRLVRDSPPDLSSELTLRNWTMTLVRMFCLLRGCDTAHIRRTFKTLDGGAICLVTRRKASSRLTTITVPCLGYLPEQLNPAKMLRKYWTTTCRVERRGGKVVAAAWPVTREDETRFPPPHKSATGVFEDSCPMFVAAHSCKPIKAATILGRTLDVLALWGWDRDVWKSHALKGACVTTLRSAGVSRDDIASVADVSSLAVLTRHYERVLVMPEIARALVGRGTERIKFRSGDLAHPGRVTEELEEEDPEGTASDDSSSSTSSSSASEADSAEFEEATVVWPERRSPQAPGPRHLRGGVFAGIDSSE